MVAAPGRVNILGEHTDYSDGLCLPAAVDRHVVCAAIATEPSEDGRFRFESEDHPSGGTWLVLAEAVAAELDAIGLAPAGARAGLASDVPEGAGLSSSAAFEVACGLALATLASEAVDLAAIAAACRRAEAAGLGVPCGPLDQIASCFGIEGGAILLDCRSLDTEAVTLPEGVALVVVDSGISRTLAGSPYADRVRECEAAARRLGVAALRDVSLEDVPAAQRVLPPGLMRRVRHVVSENARVVEAATLCRGRGTTAELGALVDESHASLAHDHEVSLPAVDDLVAACRALPGVVGARIMGAGFGGSVLALVDAAAADPAEVAARFPAPAVVLRPVDGAHVLP